MTNKNNEIIREVPKKNYLYLFLILLGSFLFLIYLYKWYETYNETKLNTSIMSDYLTVINYNELDNYIIENKDAVIYVSILGNEDITKFEKKFKNIISEYNLKNDILYLDISNENINSATKKLKVEEDFPYLVVYTNGVITDTYSINENKYSNSKVEKYLNRIGVINND